MRSSSVALAWLLAAAAATAQPAEEPAPQVEPAPRLQDVEATLDQLLREEEGQGQSQAPADPATTAAEPALPPVSPPAASPEPRSTSAPAAGPPSPPAPPLTRAQMAEIDRTVERGRLLIAIARAGIVATRDMLSRLSDPAGAGVTGWIAEPEGNAVAVTFYGNGESGPKAVYRASVLGGRVTTRSIFLGDDRPALNPLQARMAAARAATAALDHQACGSQEFNYLVVPPPSVEAPVDVYQISAPAAADRFPLGGHFRSRISADGSIAESRGFTRNCIDITVTAPADGETPRPVGITHLLDPMPVEIHLLLAQTIGRPLLVATGEPYRLWLVTPDRIAEVRPNQP
jgi:hypothetical protein